MTAPGLNYDYFEGQSFRSRTKDLPDLAVAVEAHVRQHFDRLASLNEMDPNVRIGEVHYGGQRFGFLVLKIGPRRLVLQQLWDAETEKLDLVVFEAALKLWRSK